MLYLMETLCGQPVKNDLKTYENIWKIATDQEDDYLTGCWLDFSFIFKTITIRQPWT